jgi:hypothetical protein
MPSNAAAVARNIRLWADRNLSPAALSALLASSAIKARDAAIASGEASSRYETYVDGQFGASETTVRPDGLIRYVFSTFGPATEFALGYCVNRSPPGTGAFRRAWMVLVNGTKYSGDLADIPRDAEVIITNPLPYARKVEQGHMRMSVDHLIIEEARQQVKKRFPSLEPQKIFITIPRSLGGGYVLRGRFRRGFREQARKKLASDTQAGSVMTYPALLLTGRR